MSNAWIIYPLVWDNFAKVKLILDVAIMALVIMVKDDLFDKVVAEG